MQLYTLYWYHIERKPVYISLPSLTVIGTNKIHVTWNDTFKKGCAFIAYEEKYDTYQSSFHFTTFSSYFPLLQNMPRKYKLKKRHFEKKRISLFMAKNVSLSLLRPGYKKITRPKAVCDKRAHCPKTCGAQCQRPAINE